MAFSPKTFDFYKAFASMTATLREGAAVLQGILDPASDRQVGVAKMRELEHKADGISREALDRLNRTFITPIERGDVHRLVTKLDDVLDWMYASACRIEVYNLQTVPNYLPEIAEILVRAVIALDNAVINMADPNAGDKVLAYCQEANAIENEADRKVHDGLADLFKNTTDAIVLIKIKEVLEHLENATDACEDAADAIQSVVLKSA